MPNTPLEERVLWIPMQWPKQFIWMHSTFNIPFSLWFKIKLSLKRNCFRDCFAFIRSKQKWYLLSMLHRPKGLLSAKVFQKGLRTKGMYWEGVFSNAPSMIKKVKSAAKFRQIYTLDKKTWDDKDNPFLSVNYNLCNLNFLESQIWLNFIA